jgi:hypothetical protein
VLRIANKTLNIFLFSFYVTLSAKVGWGGGVKPSRQVDSLINGPNKLECSSPEGLSVKCNVALLLTGLKF